ncbi:hypothetical protein, partial [Paraburkholderia bannensis]|uniref:hypothetical protein n=1 Tax=Paraburkholderia bannensis TaxID=765414 RepID=UPI002AB68185
RELHTSDLTTGGFCVAASAAEKRDYEGSFPLRQHLFLRRYLKAARDVAGASRRFSRQASRPVRQAAKGANISAMCAAAQGGGGK